MDVRLRPLRREDLPRLHGWYQTPELWAHLVGGFTPREENEALRYMERWLSPSETELRLGIEVDDGTGARLVGIAFFSPLDRDGGTAELHTLIGDPAERGRGIGRQAVTALLEIGFGLGLGRIHLKVLQTNTAARQVYEACGFQVVGRGAPVAKDHGPVEVLIMRADRQSTHDRAISDPP